MVTVTMSYSPSTLLFPAGERLFPVGKVGVLILYPDNIVGVWSRIPGGWENKVAGDPIVERGLLRPIPASAAAAQTFFEKESLVIGPLTGPLVLPRLMARVPESFDPADAYQAALEKAAGSGDGDAMLSTFVESMVRGPDGLFVPREFIPGPLALEDVFEDVGSLVGDDGAPKVQQVTLAEIRKARLARLAFTKQAPSPAFGERAKFVKSFKKAVATLYR